MTFVDLPKPSEVTENLLVVGRIFKTQKGKYLLVGDMNEVGGLCNDCSYNHHCGDDLIVTYSDNLIPLMPNAKTGENA